MCDSYIKKVAWRMLDFADKRIENGELELSTYDISELTLLPLEKIKEIEKEYNAQKEDGHIWVVFRMLVSYQLPNFVPILSRKTKEEAERDMRNLPKESTYKILKIPLNGIYDLDYLYINEKDDNAK